MTEEFDEEPQVVVFIAIKSWCCHSSLACNPMLFAAKVLLTSDALDEIRNGATGIAMFPPFWGIFTPSTHGNHGNHLRRRATNSKSLRVSAKQLIVQSRCLPRNKLASELLNTCCIKGGCISNLYSHSFFTTCSNNSSCLR